MKINKEQRVRAQESRAAIERLYIIMRHLFIRGSYKPMGLSGSSIIKSLLTLKPEIYGTMADEDKVELNGLHYVMDRLPKGIEQCRQINLISREGFEKANFPVIIPAKRRRNCYRVDADQMYIELTRGRSDIYDILTHLTFIFIESEKIKRHAIDLKGRTTLAWQKLEEIILHPQETGMNKEQGLAHLSVLLGRTFEETEQFYAKFEQADKKHTLFNIVYWMGKISIEESMEGKSREINFSPTLRERIGHHTYGEQWANKIKKYLSHHQLLGRPLYIISANLHSIVNSLYAFPALSGKKKPAIESLAQQLSQKQNHALRQKVLSFARKHGLVEIEDTSGTNITVQIIDTQKLLALDLSPELGLDPGMLEKTKPVILVMDYAFGEQAYETMDELLKEYENDEGREVPMDVRGVAVMGKAGILGGEKGDIMVPTAHVFEGTADNYPINNELQKQDFEHFDGQVVEGTMVSVLGTSLQNANVLEYFLQSSWKAIGLEMEGAHYQKAIQSASKIRKSISEDVKVMYAYYASDNPLLTSNTLASGSLGMEGVKPTYAISIQILKKFFVAR